MSLSREECRAIAVELYELMNKPKALFISKNEAETLYGKSNIRNWREAGQIQAVQRRYKTEFKVSDLDILGDRKQLIRATK